MMTGCVKKDLLINVIKVPMKIKKQVLNTAIIIIGGFLIIYDLAVKPEVVYFKIAGLVFLMFGLYNASKHWVGGREKDESNDYDA